MRTITIAAAILAATVSTASASCGGTWSFSADYDQERVRDHNNSFYSSSGNNNNIFDRENTDNYGVGIRFSIPLSDDDCEYTRARASKERATAQKEKDLAKKAAAEADYAANRAMKEEEFAIAKRIDNLQRIIVTCKTEDLAICDKIDEMSMELFN